jgi:hypothetical protein
MPGVSHLDRFVTAADWDGYRLGAVARAGIDSGTRYLVLNPVGAQRRTNPVNLGAFRAGKLAWALPIDRSRLTIAPDAGLKAKPVFDSFWTLLGACKAGLHGGQIWEPGHPVGNHGVEIGASGTRPTGHPWVTLCELDGGLNLVCAVSARDADREPGYQAWFDAAALQTLSGGPLSDKVGVLNPGDGAIEIAHFAVLDPVSEGWARLATMAVGEAAQHGREYALQKLAKRWPQSLAGSVLYSCDSALPAQQSCDSCAGR